MNRLKIKILNYLLRNLFNTITYDDILVYDRQVFTVAGKKLPDMDKSDIINGAENLKRMYVWEMLCKDIKYQANKLIFDKSQTIDDMIFGKAILFTIDILERKINNLSQIK